MTPFQKRAAGAFFSLLVVSFGTTSSSQQIGVQTGTPELKAIQTEHRNISSPLLHAGRESVNVWGDGKGHFYIEPYVAPDWSAFSRDVDLSCTSHASDPTQQTIAMSIQFDAPGVVRDAFLQLHDLSDAPKTVADISPYPYVFLRISTGGSYDGDLAYVVRRYFPPPLHGSTDVVFGGSTSGVTYGTNAIYLSTQQIAITDTCANLRKLATFKSLLGEMFVPWDLLKTNSYRVLVNDFAKHEAFLRLTKNETASGSQGVVQRSESGQTGFNIGGHLFGGSSSGSSSSMIVDNRTRAISGSLIEDAIQQASQTLQASVQQEFKSEAFNPAETLKLLFATVTENRSPSIARFETDANNQTKMFIDQVSFVVARSDIDLLLETSSKFKSNGKESDSGKYAAVEGSVAKDASVEDERQITWKKKGVDWVPTSAELYLTSFNELKNKSEASFYETLATTQSGLLRRTLLVINDADPQEYKNGYSQGAHDGRATVLGPPKLIIPLPDSLGLSVPQPGGNYGAPIYCMKPTEAIQKAQQLVAAKPPAGTRNVFATQIGCLNLEEIKGTCEGECLTFLAMPNCFVSIYWNWWYINHLKEIGAVGQQIDACKAAQPPPWENVSVVPSPIGQKQ